MTALVNKEVSRKEVGTLVLFARDMNKFYIEFGKRDFYTVYSGASRRRIECVIEIIGVDFYEVVEDESFERVERFKDTECFLFTRGVFRFSWREFGAIETNDFVLLSENCGDSVV